MEDPPLASLSLTHVHYNPADPFSLASAHLALVPQALVITYTALLWSTREVEILLMFTGQMACEAFNWLLKRYIKEERPTRKRQKSCRSASISAEYMVVEMHGKGYGMPSSHAQFVAFFSVFLTLLLLVRHNPHHPNATSTMHSPTPYWQRLALSLVSLASAAAVAASRIYLNYHTERQVLVGCVTGALCAVAWFAVVSVARHFGLVDVLLDTPPARWLRLRDLVVHEDLVDAGWERWELRRTRLKGQQDASKKTS